MKMGNQEGMRNKDEGMNDEPAFYHYHYHYRYWDG
jgi:hypothetical protein